MIIAGRKKDLLIWKVQGNGNLETVEEHGNLGRGNLQMDKEERKNSIDT